MTRRLLSAASALATAAVLAAPALAETKLLRFPDLHGDQVVFTYGGDLWLASASGGDARRLTSHPGLELFPKFSPDGSTIAFTGQYGGDEQVYTIPVDGGEPTQHTFYPAPGPLPERWGYDNQVYGWAPDGSGVLFRSVRDGYGLTESRLYIAPVEGGLPEPLPMLISGAGALSPDGTQVVFSPLIRDFRNWKRYEGGWAQDLYIMPLDGSESRNITDHPRTDRDPMWVGDTIYFISDRDDRLNLYSYDPARGETVQLTRHEDADARWASDDGASRIIYELAGGLRIYDVASGADQAISITVRDDEGLTRPHIVDAKGMMEQFDVAPGGARVVVSARGDVFSVPVENGVTRNLTSTPGGHERVVTWSPEGDLVAFVSDADGEEEIWVADQSGVEPPRQVTDGSTTRYGGLAWSPDGERLAFSDQAGTIFVIDSDADGGTPVEVARDPGFAVHDYVWSPDSRWIAYSAAEMNDRRSIFVWDSRSSQSTRLTSELFYEYAPAFSPDGAHLFFLGDREFAPQIDTNEWNYAQDRETRVYAFALAEDGANPFGPRNDEVSIGGGDEDDDDNGDDTPTVTIDFEGIQDRVIRVPIDADNIDAVIPTASHVLTVHSGPFYYGRDSHTAPTLMAYDVAERESFELAADIDGMAIDASLEHIVIRQNGGLKRIAIKKDAMKDADDISLSGLKTRREPAVEYAAVFDQVWRRFRDYFYVENMHGYDWSALRDQYRPLVDHVAHRSDLNYVLGDMIAELNAGHSYVSGGDMGLPDRQSVALLGARFEADGERYRIVDIFDGDNAEPKYRSPLTEVGVNVSEGDVLLAINGRPITTDDNPFEALGGLSGPVELRVADDLRGRGARNVLVEPIFNEDALLYRRWVEGNRARVDAATGGSVGYMHIPDMGVSGIYEFNKWWYGQLRKDGMIIDVRGNGGGNVSQMLINRLDRELIFTGFARGIDTVDTYPESVFTGPMAAILDEDSASDGDIFPAAFKARGLGPLIGKRSWGGVIGITNHGPLLDGGTVFVPQFGHADANGQWSIEGYGVDPDIEVDNPPDAELRGEDPQLDRAIAEVMQRIPTQPAALPTRPADPIKTPSGR